MEKPGAGMLASLSLPADTPFFTEDFSGMTGVLLILESSFIHNSFLFQIRVKRAEMSLRQFTNLHWTGVRRWVHRRLGSDSFITSLQQMVCRCACTYIDSGLEAIEPEISEP